MRLPKTIQLNGKTYKVKQNPKVFGGSGSTAKQTIIIGTESKNAQRRFENLVHEIMECVACERGYRYGKGVSEDSVFVMNHKEFDNFSVDVTAALWPMIKE